VGVLTLEALAPHSFYLMLGAMRHIKIPHQNLFSIRGLQKGTRKLKFTSQSRSYVGPHFIRVGAIFENGVAKPTKVELHEPKQ
jgi:hypothetical protein